uniref:KTx n=1 Tax=Centruroides hentzi TaxID=88313 RepID=A0A2I9LP37_9SCOR
MKFATLFPVFVLFSTILVIDATHPLKWHPMRIKGGGHASCSNSFKMSASDFCHKLCNSDGKSRLSKCDKNKCYCSSQLFPNIIEV